MIDCKHCGQYVTEDYAIAVQKFIAQGEVTLHFCSEKCACDFYIELLRGNDDEVSTTLRIDSG